MLRAAALLHLELMGRALSRGFILKDATPYNVQFQGAHPIFIDVLSLAPLEDGEPWSGYHQFCRTMLYPLMLEAYKQIPFQSWLRADFEGIDPVVFNRLFRGFDRFHKGVLGHVTAQAYFQRKFISSQVSIRNTIKAAGMPPHMIAKNVHGLKELVLRLSPPQQPTAWSDYKRTHYQAEALSQKEAFVSDSLRGRSFQLVWDLGSNDGRFSRIAARTAKTVVAMDLDSTTIDRLYLALSKERRTNILPLVMNIANPSPSQGWACGEQASVVDRGKPDMTLALALVHHLAITANVPLRALLEWLRGLTGELIIEFVSKEDPMVQRLLLNKDDTYQDYRLEMFEAQLRTFFRVVRRLELPGGTRTLYHAARG